MFLRGFLFSFSASEQESDSRRNTEERDGLYCSLKVPSPVSLTLKQLRELKFWHFRFWAGFRSLKQIPNYVLDIK